jgi:aryl-alcohol dehydrogenase-like predicted oxidoreductase
MRLTKPRLGTYIDVYQIHRLDRSVPSEEIMKALNDVVESGKVRYLGASSVSSRPLKPPLTVLTVADGSLGISDAQQHRREKWLAQVHQHAELPQLAPP